MKQWPQSNLGKNSYIDNASSKELKRYNGKTMVGRESEEGHQISYAERALEEYKEKLIEINPDAFNPNKNDYRSKIDAIKRLEAK